MKTTLRAALCSLLIAVSLPALTAPAAEPAALPSDSIYQLPARLLSQANTVVSLDVDRGHPTLISMFYGSCPAACPMLMTSLQVYESHLDEASRARLRVLLVSFDGSRDTPDKLQGIVQLHRIDSGRWTLAGANDMDARKIAALLGFRYRHNADGSFDHSLLITLLDDEGRIVATTTKLVGDETFEAQLRKLTADTGSTP